MFFNHDNTFEMNDLYHAHPKNVLTSVKPYCVEIMKHPRVHLDFKEKRASAIDQACVHYGKAYDIISMINPLTCSYLLGHSSRIVEPFTEECAKLSACIEIFEQFTNEATKSCQEVNDWYKPILKLLDKKKITSYFLDDLTYWSNTHSFEYNKQIVLSQFTDIKKTHGEYLKKIYTKKTS